MASKQGKNNSWIIKTIIALIVLGVLDLIGMGFHKIRRWEVADIMDRYEVQKDFPDPAGQRLISLVIENKPDDVLAQAKIVPGGVNAVGTSGLTPLITAVLQRNASMVRILLKAGADPNSTMRHLPLTMAMRDEDPTIAKMLLDAGADPNGLPGSVPPLLEAAELDHREDVDLLLKAGARIDAPTSLGETAAISAAAAGHIDMINHLLDHGASIWATSSVGFTVPDFGGTICLRAKSPDAECQRLTARIQAAHYPWPPPSSLEVEKLMNEGKWPPKEAMGQ